ncbi:MAG: thiamine biosynthesis protein [Desulfobulbaceae bacterium]|nr:thiamine biosynthesis protein [Desulfobulbaceae bacterium]
MKNKTTALALFSGGLDSILACRVVAEQGITVQALKFVTPFFDYELLEKQDEYKKKIRDTYGIDVTLIDISLPYLELLRNPPHGFGKHFNPCIDCKIMMLTEAKKLMDEYGASFIITGEVLGQRPMSQRKDTLRVIERDSRTDSILLRPLCAKSQPPTQAELSGLIDREKLLNFSGRGRTNQIELARSFNITDYPAPAGGCVLTDPNLSRRIKGLFLETPEIDINDIRFLLVGRQFKLPNGGWLAMGRDQNENDEIIKLKQPDDISLKMPTRPGPTALLRHSAHLEDIDFAASLVVRYGKKVKQGDPEADVTVTAPDWEKTVHVAPLQDAVFSSWIR